jgi:predicted dehydrogenase
VSFKIGLIGPGKIARTKLAPAISALDEVDLWSVMSRDLSRAREFSAAHGAISPTPAYDDLGSMLDDPQLDGVVIATPDKLHASQVAAAAARGKHVLVEKPMATDMDSAREMVAACDGAGVTLAVAYHLRHHAGLKAIKKRVGDGEFGQIHHMRVQWTFHSADDSNWRASTDVGRWWGLGGVGTHSLDQVFWFLGSQGDAVEDVRSVISKSRFGGPHDETAVVALRFADGATAEICSSVLFDAPSRFELYAEKGRVIGEGVLGTTGDGSLWVNGEPFEYVPTNPYAGEIQDFVDAVRGATRPAVSGADALQNIEVLVRAAPLDS